MKIYTIFLILLLLPFISHAQRESYEQTKNEKIFMKENKVKEITTHHTFFYKDTTYIKARKDSYELFDNKGNLIKYIPTFINDTLFPNMFENKYDQYGNRIENISYTFPIQDPSYISLTVNVQDGSTLSNNEQMDTIIWRWSGVFDKNGNCISSIIYQSNGQIDSSFTNYVYKNNQIIESHNSNSWSTKERIIIYNYKFDGENIIEKTYYNWDNSKVSSKIFYKYDSNNNLIEELDFAYHFPYENDSLLSMKRTLIYNNSNNLITEKIIKYTFNVRKEKFFSGTEYVYNQNGDKIKISELNKKGKIKYQNEYRYTYFKNGLIKSKESLGKKDKVYSITNYQYIFYE